MTRKILLIITLFASILSLSNAQSISKEMLTSGKWLNSSEGYYPTPIAADTSKAEIQPVSRYKYITFKNDLHFYMDSAKVRYTGIYEIIGNKVILTYNIQRLTKLSKNTDPNDRSGSYKTQNIELDLGVREGSIKNGVLVIDGIDYTNYSEAVAGVINFYEFSG